ncbi:hypothetical protein [Mesorhizobium sp.]|uniref:hypothetical protein n=1 Tax=Mesorhizobium sp. TaxID=1871066 RepID=UPI0025CF687C|nr:hypothetical protein [Mesorhizobium sp.]
MMKAGQVTAITPDGHMGTMMPDAKMSAEMMKMAKPIKHCMMMMTDAKGKTYMIDTSTKRPRPSVKKWRCEHRQARTPTFPPAGTPAGIPITSA